MQKHDIFTKLEVIYCTVTLLQHDRACSVVYVAVSLVVRALNLQLGDCMFDFQPPQIVLGRMTILGLANHLSISPSHPGQLASYPQWNGK